VPPTYTVSALLSEVNELLSRYGSVAVEGEVTNYTRSGAGHLYFTIKDERAQLSVVMFAMAARGLKFRIENGLKLILRGRLKIYEQRGSFQLVADAAEPAGIGALQLAFEQLKARLAAEGLFDATRKKPIPMLPQRIAVVTSPTGAAIRDVLNVLGRRFDGLSVQIYPVRVQGTTAAREIAQALRNLSRWGAHDVVIVCRGGGSLEDLWPFNEEVVARAIAACEIPTISAVGHEVDFTIADFVADLRAATPSAAAEIVVRAKGEICSQIDGYTRRIRWIVESRVARLRSALREGGPAGALGAVPRRVARSRERLQSRRLALFRLLDGRAKTIRRRLDLAREPLARFPSRLALGTRRARIEAHDARLARALGGRVETLRERLRSRVGTLQAVSPLSVLARGYAIAFGFEGARRRVLTDSAAVEIGAPVEVQLRKGKLACTVDGKTLGLESVTPDVEEG
jgi:exodeoxyribonuclease VII large subunit